jgi:glycerol uptake facilitator-like aquaporin
MYFICFSPQKNKLMTPAFVEFLGTLLLVGTVAFTGNPLFIISALALAIGLGGKISGGHFNPAVTAFQWMTGKMGQSRALMYILAQLSAAMTVWVVHSSIL